MLRNTLVLATLLPTCCYAAEQWRSPSNTSVRLTAAGSDTIKVAASEDGEFNLTSVQELDASAGGVFEVRVRIKLGLHTRALPELACYDSAGKEIPGRSSLETLYNELPTTWLTFRKLFPARPGTARVRARIRADGAGEFLVSGLEFRRAKVNAYETGALISQGHPKLRKGLVLESNLGIVNTDRVTNDDRDGDGQWAVIYSDLDKLSEPEEQGDDWRSKFEYRPNEIYWSDGAVLKSDSTFADRTPDLQKALHFRMRVHEGPYRAYLNDPGRAIAVSVDGGKKWLRFEGGADADLGTLPVREGLLEFWVDNPYRDPVSAGPAYFDLVRLLPKDGAPSVDRLFRAAKQSPAKLARSSVDEKRVPIHVDAHAPANWPVRCGLPIPQGELARAAQAKVFDSNGNAMQSQNRAMATWPDGSVKWLFLDFFHTGGGNYTVVYGNTIEVAAMKGVRISESAAGIEVDTGALRFLVPKSQFGLVTNVRDAHGSVLQADPIAVEIAESGGRKSSSLDAASQTLRVEQAGPMHAVIAVESAAHGFLHKARIHAYAGSPLIGIDYFVANTDSRRKIDVRSIAMKIKPAVPFGQSGASIQATAEAKAQGFVALNGIAAGVADFREQFPKALRWGPAGLQIDLWAAEGGDYEWIQGVGKTHRVQLYYGPGMKDAAMLAHGPLLAVADPQWYTASGAFGPIDVAANSPLSAVEATLRTHMDQSVIRQVGLGFENYGDHSSNGYVKGTFLWDNNEYDLPAGAMVHFARTGDSSALQLGLASALHYLDVDTIHYSSKRADWRGAPRTHSHGTVGHHTAGDPGMSHAGYVQGLIWYSYFTGDPAGLDGAKGIADWVLTAIKPETTMGTMERAMGHPMMTLTDVYEATWDDKYLRGAARLVDWATKWEHPVRSGFLAPITEQPAFISGSPFCAGILFSPLMKFNSWAALPELDALLERIARWTLTDMWHPPSNIMSKGGSPRRGANAQNISSELRLMRMEYLRTKNPLFLVVPREAVVAGFSGAGKEFGTRSTGLVFNYVPWFLELLNEVGRPAPSGALQAKAVSETIRVNRGGTAEACFVLENKGQDAVTGIRASFQPRLDFVVDRPPEIPDRLAAGGAVRLCYTVRAPERINLSTQYNRESYAHWSSVVQTADGPRLAHAWVKIEISPSF
jgi:hypothetical protein